MSTRDYRLEQFFAGYFNEDWDIDGSESWTDIVARFVKENRRDNVLQIQIDLKSWIDETTLFPAAVLPATFGCCYNPLPEGLTVREWVKLMVDYISKQLTS